MRVAAFLFAGALALLAACGDDTGTPDAGGYYGGVRDITIVLEETRNDIKASPLDGSEALAIRYHAEADAFRVFAAGLEALEPTAIASERHGDLVDASNALAAGFDDLASLLEGLAEGSDPNGEQEVLEQQLSSSSFDWNLACVAIDLFADDHDFACRVEITTE